MGVTSWMLRPSMKHVMQVSVQRYVTCNLSVSFHPLTLSGRQLKFLYVAITRARDNLWIMDSSESAELMKVLKTL